MLYGKKPHLFCAVILTSQTFLVKEKAKRDVVPRLSVTLYGTKPHLFSEMDFNVKVLSCQGQNMLYCSCRVLILRTNGGKQNCAERKLRVPGTKWRELWLRIKTLIMRMRSWIRSS